MSEIEQMYPMPAPPEQESSEVIGPDRAQLVDQLVTAQLGPDSTSKTIAELDKSQTSVENKPDVPTANQALADRLRSGAPKLAEQSLKNTGEERRKVAEQVGMAIDDFETTVLAARQNPQKTQVKDIAGAEPIYKTALTQLIALKSRSLPGYHIAVEQGTFHVTYTPSPEGPPKFVV